MDEEKMEKTGEMAGKKRKGDAIFHFFFKFKSVYKGVTSARRVSNTKSKDTQFAAV